MTTSQRIRLWLFYLRYPEFRGPSHPHWVGTDRVESAWRYAERLGFDAGRERERYTFPWEERGPCHESWSSDDQPDRPVRANDAKECTCPLGSTLSGRHHPSCPRWSNEAPSTTVTDAQYDALLEEQRTLYLENIELRGKVASFEKDNGTEHKPALLDALEHDARRWGLRQFIERAWGHGYEDGKKAGKVAARGASRPGFRAGDGETRELPSRAAAYDALRNAAEMVDPANRPRALVRALEDLDDLERREAGDRPGPKKEKKKKKPPTGSTRS